MARLVLNTERVIMVDVDDTLVMHHEKHEEHGEAIKVKDPVGGPDIIVSRNEPMIRLVEEELIRGSQICVWSRGGYQWAANVVEAIGFDTKDGIIVIMTKPTAYFDDSPVEEWMPDRVYLTSDTPYKNRKA